MAGRLDSIIQNQKENPFYQINEVVVDKLTGLVKEKMFLTEELAKKIKENKFF